MSQKLFRNSERWEWTLWIFFFFFLPQQLIIVKRVRIAWSKLEGKVNWAFSITSGDMLPLLNVSCNTFFFLSPFYIISEFLTSTPRSFSPSCSVFFSTGMLWQGVALCYTGFYSPSAYYPVRLNTQVGTKGQARKLQPTSLSTQHNSLTRMNTRVWTFTYPCSSRGWHLFMLQYKYMYP